MPSWRPRSSKLDSDDGDEDDDDEGVRFVADPWPVCSWLLDDACAEGEGVASLSTAILCFRDTNDPVVLTSKRRVPSPLRLYRVGSACDYRRAFCYRSKALRRRKSAMFDTVDDLGIFACFNEPAGTMDCD